MKQQEQIAIQQKIGERLKSLRKAKGLSRPKLSHLVDMDAGWIGQIEMGRVNPGAVLIIRLARALECQPGDLLNDL